MLSRGLLLAVTKSCDCLLFNDGIIRPGLHVILLIIIYTCRAICVEFVFNLCVFLVRNQLWWALSISDVRLVANKYCCRCCTVSVAAADFR